MTSNPVLQRLESWIERKKTRTNCPHLRQYPHPGYACDFQQDCESCLIVAAALELRKVTSAHETPVNEGRMEGMVYDVIERRLGLTWDGFSSRPRYLFILDAIDILMQQARSAPKAGEDHGGK